MKAKVVSLSSCLRAVCACAVSLLSASFMVRPPAITAPPQAQDAGAAREAASEVWLPSTGIDSLGRVIPRTEEAGARRSNRFVGIKYSPWHGQNDSRDYHNVVNLQETITKDPRSVADSDSPLFPDAGHFAYWDEPLFGYYRSEDMWVVRRHLLMLADAGVDFIQVDVTNDRRFKPQSLLLMKAIAELQGEGLEPPRIAFMTHNNSTEYMDDLYGTFYAPDSPYRYPTTWFRFKGKPLILGQDPSTTVRDFFTFRYAQWPNEAQRAGGWDWTSFDTPVRVNRADDGTAEQMAVSAAVNASDPPVFSWIDYYGAAGGRGRGYHDGHEDGSSSAILRGENFQEEWDRAIAVDPEVVLVEGWNEWTAGNWQDVERQGRLTFYDASSARYSRDIEPSAGVLGDTAYMQLCANIRRFKGARRQAGASPQQEIDVSGSFDQWNDVAPHYRAPVNDLARDHAGTGDQHYYNDSVGNDFTGAKVARGEDYVTFLVETKDEVRLSGSGRTMTLLLNTDSDLGTGHMGFDYAVNRAAPSGAGMTIERSTGGWQWEPVGDSARFSVSGNQMMVAVPRALLGIDSHARIDFKWIDGWRADGEPLDYYQYGDAMPSGRFSFSYSDLDEGPAAAVEPPDGDDGSLPQPGGAGTRAGGVHVIENTDKLTEYADWSSPGTAWATDVRSPHATDGSYASLPSSSSHTDPYYINTVSTVFEGTGIRWVARLAPDGVERAEVFIDGMPQGSASLRKDSVQDAASVFEKHGLSEGFHEVLVKCENVAGSVCYHDAFQFTAGEDGVPVGVKGENVVRRAAVGASSFVPRRWYGTGPAMVSDNDETTEWVPTDAGEQWLVFDLGREKAVDRIRIVPGAESRGGVRYLLEARSSDEWVRVHEGVLGGGVVEASFDRTTARSLRLRFEGDASPGPIAEVSLSDGANSLTSDSGALASSANTGHEPSKTVDGHDGTYWCATSSQMPQWIQYDFGRSAAVGRVDIDFYAHDSWRYKVDVSEDGVSWTTGADRTNDPLDGRHATDRLGLVGRYLRITVTGSASNWAAIREVNAVADEYMGSVAASGTFVSASSENAGYNAAKAVDGSGQTYWCAASGAMPQTLTLDMGSLRVLSRVRLDFYAHDDWYYWDQVSQDGSNWSVAASVHDESGQRYAVPVRGTYRYIRINVRSSRGNWAAIRELVVEARQQ